MSEKLQYEQPIMTLAFFVSPQTMLLSDIDWSEFDKDGDGWTDGWV